MDLDLSNHYTDSKVCLNKVINSDFAEYTTPLFLNMAMIDSVAQEEYLFAALVASEKYAKTIKKIWPKCEIGALRSGKNVDSSDLVHAEFTQVQEAIYWNPCAAIIASPANLHVKQALNLTRNNIPTLIEKPIGTGDEPIDELNELEQLSKKIPVYIAYILRQDPGADLVKEFISEGMVGKIISARFSCGSWLPDWRSPIDYRQCVGTKRIRWWCNPRIKP